ncbi:S26 family signal peptidase [Streptomyces olivoreticuli]
MTPGWVTLALAALSRKLVVVTVRGASMAPAFQDGDRVLVRRGPPPAVGHVVVAERPARGGMWPGGPVRSAADVRGRQWLIKRVEAVPGDRVPRALASVPQERVPPGKLVLLGDNRAVSVDSRELGYFPADRVLGVVLRRPGAGLRVYPRRPAESRGRSAASRSPAVDSQK